MFRDNYLVTKLKSKSVALGIGLSYGNVHAAEALSFLDFDAFVSDFRQGDRTLENFACLQQATQHKPAAHLLIAEGVDPVFIKRALDVGVEGLLVPVNCAAAAKLAVVSSRFKPQGGIRGIGYPMARSANWSTIEDTYPQIFLDQLLMGALIADRQSLTQAYEISQVEGIDIVAFDVSNLTLDDDLREQVARIRKSGVWVAGLAGKLRQFAADLDTAFDLLLVGSEQSLLEHEARSVLTQLKACCTSGSND